MVLMQVQKLKNIDIFNFSVLRANRSSNQNRLLDLFILSKKVISSKLFF